MSSVVFLLYICGLLNNTFLFFWVYNSWSSPGRLNNIVLVQLFLNTWNIITHAAVELTKQHIWIVSATTFSFFSIYSLAALMLAAALGKPMQQRLNSKRNIIIFAIITSLLLVFYGRRYKLCRSENCFSPQLAYVDEKYLIWKSDFTAFYVPTAVIFFGSWYLGFRSYMFSRVAFIERGRQSCLKRCSLFCSNIAVSLFILYGLFVIDGILYFNEDNETTISNHLCRMSCLHEELYLLLSIFPVYMGYFIKQNEARLHQEEI